MNIFIKICFIYRTDRQIEELLHGLTASVDETIKRQKT